MKKMHILMILPYSYMKIPIRPQLAEVFGTYLSIKHKISVIIFSNRDSIYKWNELKVYELNTLNNTKIKSFMSFVKILKILLKEKVDLIFCRNIFVVSPIFLIIFKILNISIILQLTIPIRTLFNAPLIKKPIILLRFKLITKFSNLILPISHSMGIFLQKILKISKKKIYPFPDGVNLEKFGNNNEKINNHELNKEKYSIIYIGTLDSDRELDFLIKVMRLVCDKVKDANLLFVGDGSDKQKLLNLVKEYNLIHNIEFTGHVDYSCIPKLLKKSLIGISPYPLKFYYRFVSPLKLFEYMGAGLVIVANKEVYEQKNVLQKTKGGILVSYSTKEFANEIIKLLNNEYDLDLMRRQNINWVKKNRDYKILAKNLEKQFYYIIKTKF